MCIHLLFHSQRRPVITVNQACDGKLLASEKERDTEKMEEIEIEREGELKRNEVNGKCLSASL